MHLGKNVPWKNVPWKNAPWKKCTLEKRTLGKSTLEKTEEYRGDTIMTLAGLRAIKGFINVWSLSL